MSGVSPQHRLDALRRVEGIGDPAQLADLCPRCQNRGWVRLRTGIENCDCPAGRFAVYHEAALNTLTAMYGEREARRWLEDRSAEFGGERPLYLLRDERAPRVFEVIRRDAAVRGIPPPVVPSFEGFKAPKRAAQTLQDTTTERLAAELRTAGRHAAALLLEQGKVEEMVDADRAFHDALVCGVGYLVDGKRTSPDRVKVLRHSYRR